MRRAPLAVLLLLLWSVVGINRCSPNPSGDPARIDPRTVAVFPLNIPIDTDLDGKLDTIRVGDFDGDGQLEILDDLQAAMNTLDDPDWKLLLVEPGTFLPPPNCEPGSPCWCRLMPHYNANGIACYGGPHDPRGHALLQLPSYTTLRCRAGSFQTTFALWDYDDPAAPDANYAAVGNRDYEAGNRNITVEQCGWRGGARKPYDLAWAYIGRRGLDFHNVEDSLIRSNYASYFYHAGIFVESSRRMTIRDNVLERDSGYGNNLGPAATQSSIYIYNHPDATPSSDILIEGNTLLDPGGNAISLRNDFQDAGKLIERVQIRGNSIYSHGTGSCLLMRGSRDVEVRDHYCEGTLFGFGLDGFATGFGQQNSNDGVLVDGLTLVKIVAPNGGSSLYLAPYHSDVTFRNVVVDGAAAGSAADCMAVRPPFRNVRVEDFTLRNCGGNGIQFYANAVDPTIDVVGRTPDEALVLERGTIRDVDASSRRDWTPRSGIVFATAGARSLTLRDVTIDGVTGNGIELWPGRRLESSLFENLDIRRVAPRFRGMGTKAALGPPACTAAASDDWVIVTNAQGSTDCNLSGGTGTTTTRCRCEDGVWRRVTNHMPGHMIALEGGFVFDTTFSNLLLHEAGAETPAYAFELDGSAGTYLGNFFDLIHVSDALDGKTWGVGFQPGSAGTTNRIGMITCEGSAAAQCLVGAPPTSP